VATGPGRLLRLSPAAFERGTVIGFETDEGSIEHFPARHDDDVEAGGHLVAPEHLTSEALGAVAID
jgi:hypothetical protein